MGRSLVQRSPTDWLCPWVWSGATVTCATLTLVREVRLSKKEDTSNHCHPLLMLPPLLIFSVQVVQVFWNVTLLYGSGSQSFKILWRPHFQGKQSKKTAFIRRRKHSVLKCQELVTQYTPLLVYFSVSSHRLSFLVCLLFPFPYLYIIPVLISLHPCFPFSVFQNTWRFKDTIQNIHSLVSLCLRSNFLYSVVNYEVAK